jgi:hypothetical protein
MIINYQMYTCTGVLILTVKLMCLFIKQIRDICLAKTNIVLQRSSNRLFLSHIKQGIGRIYSILLKSLSEGIVQNPPQALEDIGYKR